MDTSNSLLGDLRKNRDVVPINEGLGLSSDIKRMLNGGEKASITNGSRKLPPPQTRSKK